ncbi:MAG: cytochrome c [Chlorobium sp.]|uniref:c-type cytochrome n=1 Tax=Chlorobium sp. TaxID=1095 RepID=UPI002F42A4D3
MKNVLYLSMLFGIASGLASSDATAKIPDGREVFDRNCSVCHSINPPPKSAPPVIPLANRYRQKFQTKAEGVAYMAAFLKKPDKDKAIDANAVSRFGLMPAIPLTDAELKAVASWFWDQYNPSIGGGRGLGGGKRGIMNQ